MAPPGPVPSNQPEFTPLTKGEELRRLKDQSNDLRKQIENIESRIKDLEKKFRDLTAQ